MVKKRDRRFFEGVLQVDVDFEGEKAKLPIFYYDTSCLTAIFPASLCKLRRILPKKDFHPLPVVPGVGALAITAFEYRDTDIRPYNEISISILISYRKRAILPMAGLLESLARNEIHTYIHHLPVTTAVALNGGVQVYNYPKFLSEIPYEDRGDHIYTALREKGEPILEMRARKLPVEGERLLRFVTYPVKSGRAQEANVLFHAKKIATSFNPGCVEIQFGKNHPIGRELEDLILWKKAIYYMYVPESQAILYGPSFLE